MHIFLEENRTEALSHTGLDWIPSGGPLDRSIRAWWGEGSWPGKNRMDLESLGLGGAGKP